MSNDVLELSAGITLKKMNPHDQIVGDSNFVVMFGSPAAISLVKKVMVDDRFMQVYGDSGKLSMPVDFISSGGLPFTVNLGPSFVLSIFLLPRFQ